jgi:hypothetical protein
MLGRFEVLYINVENKNEKFSGISRGCMSIPREMAIYYYRAADARESCHGGG